MLCCLLASSISEKQHPPAKSVNLRLAVGPQKFRRGYGLGSTQLKDRPVIISTGYCYKTVIVITVYCYMVAYKTIIVIAIRNLGHKWIFVMENGHCYKTVIVITLRIPEGNNNMLITLVLHIRAR